jgi:RNA 2',3'-cyclic 3'-phosphodiesterase
MSARPLRLFVAAYPPAEVARALLDQLAAMSLKDIRLSPLEQVHLTLQFIGDTEVRDLPAVKESVDRAAAGLSTASVEVPGLISLPERGRARLVAAELEAHPALLELHRRLARRLAKNARERSSDRFLPHMTLGRFPSGSGDRVEAPVSIPLRFEVSDAVLVQSILRPQGAEHRPVARFPLSPGRA